MFRKGFSYLLIFILLFSLVMINYDANKQDQVSLVVKSFNFSQNNSNNNPLYSNQWSLYNKDYDLIDTGATLAWETTKGSPKVIVGIIDSGIDYNHPDLINSIWINSNEIAGNDIDDDQNGYIDDMYGYDFASMTDSPMDDNGHGTHVAGIIAASDNYLGMVGLAPNTKIMALKVMKKSGPMAISDIVAAINYGKINGVRIFNLSFGMSTYSRALYDAIKDTDALFICAAGNGGADKSGDNNDKAPFYPASYELDNIIAVSSIDQDGSLSSFANYGLASVDIAAPGDNIISTTITNNQYTYMDGTSMANAYVSATAALALSVNPKLSVANLKTIILLASRPLSGLTDKVVTSGIIDANQTVKLASPNYNILSRLISVNKPIEEDHQDLIVQCQNVINWFSDKIKSIFMFLGN